MKIGDLRLGNWVKIDVGVGQVCCLMSIEFEDWAIGENMPISVDVEGYDTPRACTIEEVEGIPLTEEILLSCGFRKKHSPIAGYVTYSIYINSIHDGELSCLNIYNKENEYLIKQVEMNKISYVHELQNVFYLVNKEELEVKL